MDQFLSKMVTVITQDGRFLVGQLKGFDQSTNLILADTHERVFSLTEGASRHTLGLHIIRGDTVAIIGELDEAEDAIIDLEQVRAAPLNPVVY